MGEAIGGWGFDNNNNNARRDNLHLITKQQQKTQDCDGECVINDAIKRLSLRCPESGSLWDILRFCEVHRRCITDCAPRNATAFVIVWRLLWSMRAVHRNRP